MLTAFLIIALAFVIFYGYVNYNMVVEYEATHPQTADTSAEPFEMEVPPPVLYTMCAAIAILLLVILGLVLKMM